MKKLILIVVILIAFSVFVGCNGKKNVNQKTGNKSSGEETKNVLENSTSQVTTKTKQAKLDSQVYKNEDYGYQITLFDGFSAEVESRRRGEGQNKANILEQDRVIVKDKNGDVYCEIYTPMLEIGYEMWEVSEEDKISVSGSDIVINWTLRTPLDELKATEKKIAVINWVSDADSSKTGTVYKKFNEVSKDEESNLRTMVESLKFSN